MKDPLFILPSIVLNIAPRWQMPLYWQSPDMLPLALLAAVLLILGLLSLYSGQLRGIRWPWRWIIPGLRAAALIALALGLAKPIAVWTHPARERGTVLVLLDRSRSMSISDAGRQPAELVALANGLGLLPQGARAEATARLAASLSRLEDAAHEVYRAQGELDYARVSGRGLQPADARLGKAANDFVAPSRALAAAISAQRPGPEMRELRQRLDALTRLPRPSGQANWPADARRRLAEADAAITAYQSSADERLYDSNVDVRRICDALDHSSRFTLAQAVLLSPKTGLISRLGDQATAVGFTFAQHVSPLGILHPASQTPATTGPSDKQAGDIGVDAMDVTPDGPSTDLAGAVAAALARVQSRDVRAIVVFSDGRQVGAESRASAGLSSAGIPVFTIAAASSTAPRDLSFGQVITPRIAFVGETISVRATLRAVGLTADPATVRLSVDDGAAQLPQVLEEQPDDRRTGRRDESRRWATFSLKMDTPGVHLLTLSIPSAEGEATDQNNQVQRWIKVLPEKIPIAAFAGTPGLDFQYLGGALERRPWFDVQAGVLDPSRPRLPLTAEQILRQEVIVLADVPVEALDTKQWSAVNKLVRERGGSVIFLAGEANLPGNYAAQPLAAALLPFPSDARPAWRTWPGERPSFRLAPGLHASPDLLRPDDGDNSTRRWQGLPGLFRIMPLTTLKPNVKILLIEPDLRAAVLTEMRFGLGRAFFLGTNETWRWRPKNDHSDLEWFWLQLVRHAAEEPYAARHGDLALDADRVSASPQDMVHIRARVFGDAAATAAGELKLEIVRQDRVIQILPLTSAVAGSGRFIGKIDGLPDGDYLLRLIGPANGASGSQVDLPLHIRSGYEAELADLSGDPDRLRRLAESTGGEMLRLDQVDLLPERLALANEARPRTSELPLWDSPYLFGFIVACLAGEWALRKQFGLV